MSDQNVDDPGNGGAPEGGAPSSSNPPPGGDPRADFLSAIPEEYHQSAALQDYSSIGDLVKSHVEQQKMLGVPAEQLLKMPGPESTEEQRAEFFAKLGRPDTPDDYGLAKPDDWPEDLPFDNEAAGEFSKKAHELGLTKEQAQGIMNWYNGKSRGDWEGAMNQAKEGVAQMEARLKQEFGAAYEERVNLGKEALKQYGDPEFVEFLETTGLGNHPAMVKTMAKVAMALKDDGLLEGSVAPGRFQMTPEEANEQIGTLQSDKEFMAAYMDKKNPGHQAAVQKMSKLHDIAASGNNQTLFRLGDSGRAMTMPG